MMHQVKFTNPETNEVVFGVAISGVAVKDKPGHKLVLEVIKGNEFIVPSDLLEDIELGAPVLSDSGYWIGDDELGRYVDQEYKKAEALSDALPAMGVGSMFGVRVEDGGAYYVVTKVNKRTVRHEWRGFHPSRLTDAVLGWGGSLPIAKARELCGRAKGLKELFEPVLSANFKKWCEKYYNVHPKDAAAKGAMAALDHSILKWEGLQEDVLAEYGLYISGGILCNLSGGCLDLASISCALCQLQPTRGCRKCPLYQARGVACFKTNKDEERSPWHFMLCKNNTAVMLKELKETKKWLTEDDSTT